MIRFLHTRVRSQDLDKSIAFYQALGFNLAEYKDSPQGNCLAFLTLPDNEVFLELCYSPEYRTACPEDLMHIALGVEDIISYCAGLEANNIAVWPENWKEAFASGKRKMAFVTDPDGFEVEILEI